MVSPCCFLVEFPSEPPGKNPDRHGNGKALGARGSSDMAGSVNTPGHPVDPCGPTCPVYRMLSETLYRLPSLSLLLNSEWVSLSPVDSHRSSLPLIMEPHNITVPHADKYKFKMRNLDLLQNEGTSEFVIIEKIYLRLFLISALYNQSTYMVNVKDQSHRSRTWMYM